MNVQSEAQHEDTQAMIESMNMLIEAERTSRRKEMQSVMGMISGLTEVVKKHKREIAELKRLLQEQKVRVACMNTHLKYQVSNCPPPPTRSKY